MTFIQSESLLNFPYDSRRKPVLARNIVVTSQPLAAQAGSDMLRRGGNAVDAALAAAIALTVGEPFGCPQQAETLRKAEPPTTARTARPWDFRLTKK